MHAVVPSVPQFALIKSHSPLIFQIKTHKPLLCAQPAKLVRCAAKVCAFLFKILSMNRVLSVQIVAFCKQQRFWCQCGLLDYQCRQSGEKFVLIWYSIALKFAEIKN